MSRWLNSISGKTTTLASTANPEKANIGSLTIQITAASSYCPFQG